VAKEVAPRWPTARRGDYTFQKLKTSGFRLYWQQPAPGGLRRRSSRTRLTFPGLRAEYVTAQSWQLVSGGPCSWVALSGDPEDITAPTRSQGIAAGWDEHLHQLAADMARGRASSSRDSPARICWVGQVTALDFGLAHSRGDGRAVGESGALVIGRETGFRLGGQPEPRDEMRCATGLRFAVRTGRCLQCDASTPQRLRDLGGDPSQDGGVGIGLLAARRRRHPCATDTPACRAPNRARSVERSGERVMRHADAATRALIEFCVRARTAPQPALPARLSGKHRSPTAKIWRNDAVVTL